MSIRSLLKNNIGGKTKLKSSWCIFFVFLFVFSSFCYAQASATGSHITWANLSISYYSQGWQLFFGFENYDLNGSNVTIVPNPPNLSMQSLYFPSTYKYYLVSMVPNPFSSSVYSVPSLVEVDQYFAINEKESVSYLFSDSSAFTFYTGSSNNLSSTTLVLPTLYLSGANPDGITNPYAFRQGIVKLGSDFLFVIPKNTSYLQNGSSVDFLFALPYNPSSQNEFYLFALDDPLEPTEPISFSWEYDYNSKTITIYSEIDADIFLQSELGTAYTGVTNSSGLFSIQVPAGFNYHVVVSKSGFIDSQADIYISVPVLPSDSSSNSANAQFLRVDTPSVCIGADCYELKEETIESAKKESDLFCDGDLCYFVGISEPEFVDKYRLKKIPSANSFSSIFDPYFFDLNKLFGEYSDNYQYVLSRFGSTPFDFKLLFYPILFLLVLLALSYIFNPRNSKKFQGGYD